METYYTNTTNITCQSNLLVRKHTLESRLDELKREFIKRTSNLVLNKTKNTINNTINNYKKQASMLLNDDGFRNNVTAVVGPVFETTKTLHKLSNAIKTKQENFCLVSNNKDLSDDNIHKNIKTIRMINWRKKQREINCLNEKIDTLESKIDQYETALSDPKHCKQDKNSCHTGHNDNHSGHSHNHYNEINHSNIKDYEFMYFMRSKPILKVDKFINKMKKEDYEYLISKLNPDYVSRLTICLVKLKKRANCNYKSIIQNYITIIEMIFLNVNLKNTLKNAINQADRYKLDSEILRNNDKLKEYIDNLKNGARSFLPDIKVTTKLRLSRRYRIYVRKYGFPENELFCPERMLEIDCMLERSDCSSSSDSDC